MFFKKGGLFLFLSTLFNTASSAALSNSCVGGSWDWDPGTVILALAVRPVG